MIKAFLGWALLCVSVAAGAEPVEVVLPFDPPLGKPLHYRQTGSTSAGVSSTAQLTVEFRREGEGYVMTSSFAVPAGAAAANPAAALVARPISLHVDASGRITGMVDEAGYLDAMQKVFDMMAAKEPSTAQSMRMFSAQIRGMTSEARIAFLTQNIAPIIRYSASRHRVAEAVVTRGDAQTPLGKATRTITETLERVSGGVAHFTAVSRVPPEQIAAMVDAATRHLPNARKIKDEYRLAGVEDLEDADVDVATGLARHFSSTQAIFVMDRGKRERMSRTSAIDLVE